MPRAHRPRVFLDTNIFLSGLFWRGTPHLILAVAAEGCIELILSDVVMEEAAEVIAEKWPRKVEMLEEFVDSLPRVVRHQRPSERSVRAIAGSIRDPDDASLLAAVRRVRRLDAFVTGDKDFFGQRIIPGVRPINPADFLRKYRQPLLNCAEKGNPSLTKALDDQMH